VQLGKVSPWALSVLFALVAAAQWYGGTQKDREIDRLQRSQDQLLASANAKLAAVTEEANTKLAAITADANAKLVSANLPQVPVRISTRKAVFADGLVIGVENTSGSTIVVKLDIERSSSSKMTSLELTIDGGRAKEVGQNEGWAFVKGDTVTISEPDHKSMVFSI
jgi:hypothetical protein